MIEALLIEGVTKAVVDAGMDHLGRAGSSQDLAPVISALQGLNEQSEAILATLARPTQTAGTELCERAATAYANGWFDDALKDAEKSIEVYPYSAKPRLIGGLAALALSRGDAGLQHLISAVKYSANGQPDIGALAGVLAAHLASAVGGNKLALNVIAQADQVTGGRCPAVVSTLVRFTPDDAEAMKRLRRLWWTEHYEPGLPPTQATEKIRAAAHTLTSEYAPGGAVLREYLRELAKRADAASRDLRSASSVRETLLTAISTPPIDYVTIKAFTCATNVRIRWFDSVTPSGVLKACVGQHGVSARPPGPTMATIDDLKMLRQYAEHVRTGSSFVLRVLNELPEIATRASTSAANRSAIERALPMTGEMIKLFRNIEKISKGLSAHRVFDTWDRLESMIEPADQRPILHVAGLTTDVWKAIGDLPSPNAPAKRTAVRGRARATRALPA